eukprot:6172719-Pleurochrysis_carterae.AAC.2
MHRQISKEILQVKPRKYDNAVRYMRNAQLHTCNELPARCTDGSGVATMRCGGVNMLRPKAPAQRQHQGVATVTGLPRIHSGSGTQKNSAGRPSCPLGVKHESRLNRTPGCQQWPPKGDLLCVAEM